ncbi:hypothetical protein [Lederbergia ruris]|nr:hypothetical protein [Lederbergia ruris]
MGNKLKSRSDFSTEREYMSYTKTSDFLLNYSWKGKSKETIINEMALPDFEQVYLDEAIEYLTNQNDFSGMSLDRFILKRLDEDEEADEFNPNDIIFIEREE